MRGGRKREGERQREGCFKEEISEYVCQREEAHGKGKAEDRLERRSLMEQCQKRWWLGYVSLKRRTMLLLLTLKGKRQR